MKKGVIVIGSVYVDYGEFAVIYGCTDNVSVCGD